MSEHETSSELSAAQALSDKNEIPRRKFLNGAAAAALSLAGVGAVVVTVRYLSPNVLFEPSMRFSIGSPEKYPIGSVTYIADQEVYIVRTPAGIFAESSICTHLGCITQWKPELNLIACPCHGSRFSRNGTVVHGPAPVALPHFAVRMMPDGDLEVNKLDVVAQKQILRV
jgi:cytochrome b6-f complex iron-sulfur subunit